MIQHTQISSDLWETSKGLHFFILIVFYISREVVAQRAYLAEMKHVSEDAAKSVSWSYNAICKKPYEKHTKSAAGGGAA